MPKGQYNFVNYEPGTVIAGVTVEKPSPTMNGNARWYVRHPCGHARIITGISLRQTAKRGKPLRCWECKPKKPIRP